MGVRIFCSQEDSLMIDGYKIAAVCTSRIHEEYVNSYINELNSVLTEHGWRVLVYSVNSDLYHKTRSDTGEAAVFDLIDPGRTDALILFWDNLLDESVREKLVETARKNDIPAVVLNHGVIDGCINMMFDYENGFRDMVRHVFEHHRINRIHMIAGSRGVETSEVRIAVVKELAEEFGVSFGDDNISYGDYWSRPTVEACEALIAKGDLPEAIICANDTMAIAASGVFRNHGIKVPDDIIITGFDGINETKYTSPKISTVKCDFGELGKASAEVLLSGDTSPRSIYIMPDLLPSESCGCSPAYAVDVSEVLTSYWNMFERYRNDERKLNIMSSKVQSCTDLDEVEKILNDRVFYEMVCVLKKECTDPSCDPLTVNTDTTFGRDMVVLFDTDRSYIGKDRRFDISQILPRLGELFERKIPLIFTAVHYSDIALGYICYFFSAPNQEEYNKIAQTSGYINSAVSGYRNMRYQHRLREWIEEVYKYDELTGLYTRKSFCKEYERMLEEEGCTEMTLVLCDLDGLKYINDNFGHSEGDMAIRVVAKALELACPGGICSKHGGDELLAAVPRIVDTDKVKHDIETFINDYNEASCKPYKVSSSIGICTVSGGDMSFSKLFAEADDLMYTDKVKKKNNRARFPVN